MKIKNTSFLSIPVTFLLFVSTLSVAIDAPAQRNYHCRMPPRVETQNSNVQKLPRIAKEKDSDLYKSLFGDLDLTEKKAVRLKKICSDYTAKIRKLSKKSNNGNKGCCASDDKKITKTTVSFLNSVQRELTPEQYDQFNKNLNGKPNSIGPMMKGPDPVLMTGEN